MAANSRPFLRAAALFFLIFALLVAGQPASVHAEPSSDGITYVVKSGDRLVDIAAKFGVSASAIVRANGLANADTIYPGQKLVIPGATPAATDVPTPAAAGSSATAQHSTYTVQLGDTLASIARSLGVALAALQQANAVSNPDLIWVGQKLIVPGAAATGASQAPALAAATPAPAPSAIPLPSTSLAAPTAVPRPTATATATPAPTPEPVAEIATPKIYVVQAGDTLARIAQRNGVSVEALVAANGLGSADLIGVGVRLIIPGKGDTGTDVATAPKTRPTKFVASISQQRCWVYSGETVIARWVCSTGRRGSPSVPGTYKVQSKLPKAYGSTWNIWMPFWLGIYWAGASENGIHGLPWDAKSGVQIWSGNVGKPITFGCIMLDNVNAKLLYDMAWIGMPVVVLP
jgi:LysM repeat protein